MSINCIKCVKNRRTGLDLLCDDCRRAEAEDLLRTGTVSDQVFFAKDDSHVAKFDPIPLIRRVRQAIEGVKLPRKCSLNLCRERCDAAAVKAIEEYFGQCLPFTAAPSQASGAQQRRSA